MNILHRSAKSLLERSICVYLNWLSRGKRRFFVTGMSRSGNHAIVAWLVNALEEKNEALITDEACGTRFQRTGSGRTVFLNDVGRSGRSFAQAVWSRRREIRQSDFIVVSTEERRLDYLQALSSPSTTEAIVIRRSTLNLVASRLHRNASRAQTERAGPTTKVDEQFMQVLLDLSKADASQWHVCWFDRWVDESPDYRTRPPRRDRSRIRLGSRDLQGGWRLFVHWAGSGADSD